MKSIQYEQIQREAEISTLAAMMREGIAITPGESFTWQARFGDEGPSSWTRGRSSATVAMISAAEESL